MPLHAGTIAASPAVSNPSSSARARAAPHFVGVGFVTAFVAVTLAGFVQAASAPAAFVARDTLPSLALACCVYAVLGTVGLYRAERRGTRTQLLIVIGLLVALGAVTTFATHGYAAMLLMAAVSAGVLHAGSTGSVVVTAISALVALLAFALRSTLWSAFLQAGVTFGSGIAFVFVFSRIALREQRARAELQQLSAALAVANQRLQDHADHVEQLATVKERNRIAREIHDGLAHALTVVHIQLEAAQTLLESSPVRARAALVKAQQLAHEGLGEVRRSVVVLRGTAPERPPLIAALELFVRETCASGIEASLRMDGSPRRLPEPTEFTLYRAAQEALTNVRRHARATRVEIALVFTALDTVALCIQDNGQGAQPPSAGFGLVGLRERVELAGGTVSITTAPGRGFRLELQVPG
jgi:signal transduction histidine kinase